MDKIICVGKNYLKHALELGDAVPEEPLYFIKPPSTIFLASSGKPVALPKTGEVHHELELVLKISEDHGRFYFSHYTFGLDLTIRDLQVRLKKAGQPWEKSKVFRNSSILGEWQKIESLEDVLEMSFTLKVNNQIRQHGKGNEMRFQPLMLIEDLQRWFPLCDGDILFTGTPEGVGPIFSGDKLEITGGKVQYSITVQ